MRKKLPLVDPLTVDQDCQLADQVHLPRSILTQKRDKILAQFFKRLGTPQNLSIEKTKLLILNFKISHLSVFFKEQRSCSNSLCPGVYSSASKDPNVPGKPVMRTSKAGCNVLRLPTRSGLETQDGNAVTRQQRGGL